MDIPAKGTGNWQISLAIKGTGGEVSIQDGGVFVCSFVYSDDEVYQRTSEVYFYGQYPKHFDPYISITYIKL